MLNFRSLSGRLKIIYGFKNCRMFISVENGREAVVAAHFLLLHFQKSSNTYFFYFRVDQNEAWMLISWIRRRARHQWFLFTRNNKNLLGNRKFRFLTVISAPKNGPLPINCPFFVGLRFSLRQNRLASSFCWAWMGEALKRKRKSWCQR